MQLSRKFIRIIIEEINRGTLQVSRNVVRILTEQISMRDAARV